jgi:hypothetical protein
MASAQRENLWRVLWGVKIQIMPGSGYPNNAFDHLRIFSLSIVDDTSITLR